MRGQTPNSSEVDSNEVTDAYWIRCLTPNSALPTWNHPGGHAIRRPAETPQAVSE